MNSETSRLIIELMAERISQLEGQLRSARAFNDFYETECEKLEEELKSLKPKRGRPAKKRGPGRPKGSKND
jgi:hypothetical protein